MKRFVLFGVLFVASAAVVAFGFAIAPLSAQQTTTTQKTTAKKAPTTAAPKTAPPIASAAPAAACCVITAINASTGVVTGRVNASGQIFTFTASGSVLSSVKVGQGVYANFTSKQVSINGTTACCSIASGSAAAAPAAANPAVTLTEPAAAPATTKAAPTAAPTVAAPAAACCGITAIDVGTGDVTARVTSTGQTFTFTANSSVLNSLKVGQAVYANLTTKQVSLDGKTISGTIIATPAATAVATPAVTPAATPAAARAVSPGVAAATNLGISLCATASSAAYLEISGIQGESTDACYKGQIELLSVSVDGNNFSVVKRMDSTSGSFWTYCIGKQTIPQATITLLTAGSGGKKVTYTLRFAKVTSVNASAGRMTVGGGSLSTQETIVLAAAYMDTANVASTAAVEASAQPPAVQISLALEAAASPDASNTAAPVAPSISVNTFSVQMATGNKPTFVIGKAIDSTSPQFQQAYLQKTPIAHVVITFQRSSDNFTVTLANATVTNDIQTSGGSGSSEQVTLSTDRLIFENASP